MELSLLYRQRISHGNGPSAPRCLASGTKGLTQAGVIVMNNKIISLAHKLLKYLDSCVVMNILIEIMLQLFCVVTKSFLILISSQC